MKKIFITAIIAALALSFSACGTSNETTATGTLDFSTEDFGGNPVTFSDYSDADLIMINFWEPWCGPCVGEMPELEKLYETYADEGFMILGVYSTEDSEDEIAEILDDAKITYPILKCDDNLAAYRTDYYPTTFFVDGDGNVLSEEPYIGANDYQTWEKILKSYLD